MDEHCLLVEIWPVAVMARGLIMVLIWFARGTVWRWQKMAKTKIC